MAAGVTGNAVAVRPLGRTTSRSQSGVISRTYWRCPDSSPFFHRCERERAPVDCYAGFPCESQRIAIHPCDHQRIRFVPASCAIAAPDHDRPSVRLSSQDGRCPDAVIGFRHIHRLPGRLTDAPGCRARHAWPSLACTVARRNGRCWPRAPHRHRRSVTPSAKCSSVPTPPDAITGISTASDTARSARGRIRAASRPRPCWSDRISPAPRRRPRAPSRRHRGRWAYVRHGCRPPTSVARHALGIDRHDDALGAEAVGAAPAPGADSGSPTVLIDTLSAPALSRRRTSSHACGYRRRRSAG